MKTKITFLLFMITTISLSQSSEKWNQYIKKENERKLEKYYLTSLENAHRNKYKVVKKLDSTFCIVENISLRSNALLEKNLPVNNLWKLPSNFSNHKENKQYIIATDSIKALITDLKSGNISDITILDNHLVLVKSDSKKIIDEIIALNSVSSISQESLQPKGESKITDQNFSINSINKANTNFPVLTGENQVVSIKDDFFDVNDIDLLNKHIASTVQSSIVSSHATAMATIVSGLGNSSALGKGVAPKAKIQSSDFLSIYPDEVATLEGAVTQNHSYGTTIENFYGSLANAYDSQLFLNTNLTHCFSSGNTGLQGYKSITGNFKQSKNSIVVGCIDQNEIIMPFSSKGPAYDGRIKPELVAFSTQGTSNSTAVATGVITLMKQHYKTIYNTSLTNALTKAILINSAKDLGNPGPDFTYGYGNINADKSLKTISENRIISGNLTSGQTNLHTITLPANAKNLKITLVWNDLPAAINSNISLINDLDIEVVSADNTTYLPWILNPEIPGQQAARGKDKINTVEQVTVENPTSGSYNIHIIGSYISNASQEYSIVYGYELKDEFEWNYPVNNDNFPHDGKTISPFKWNSSFSGIPGQLSISYNNGQSWEIIANDINLNSGQFTYTPATQKFSKAKLKMTINTIDYISDSFTISYDLNIRTSLVCDGTTEINWDKPAGVSSFNLYQLINDQLEFKEQTTNATYAYTDAKIYTVVPVFDNSEGIKSESTLPYAQNSNCYFELTLAEVYEQNKVKIDASLFSLYNIKRIDLVKVIDTTEAVISTINDINSKTISFFDDAPTKGSNKYKINIILENNTVISSLILDTNYLGDNLFFVHPTIVSKNEELNIEAKKEENAIFYLYNLSGQNTITSPLLSKTNNVSLKNTASGIYIYKIVTNSGEIQTGKIAVF
ncbi:putative secreted protein (Por secretion system target) [Flavobacterium araucananum]|uniref:Secretion protein n=1 Tax=Flavobacterium araucananum TaxID=946678 RepID=A0A227P3Y6_9FLAO|nr:S8 family serine peptidase [Flavobacterium araucananum]OXG03948.1 secretion protein [Flavobacterium araucananum]PWJ98454.1 putative secreted protein (Por secretion system target) [Flavobacterium araucananum]